MSYRPAGSWCDVCVLPDGRIAFVRAEPSMVICEIDGVFAWGVLTPSPLLFVRCAALADGTVAAIGKANDPQGSALLILRGKVLPLGPTAGNNPVALTSTHAYIVTAPATAHRVRFDDGFSEPVPLPWVSTGIRDMRGDFVITADSTYAATIRGYNFGEYQTRGDLTVGQHGFGIGVLIGSRFFLARQGSTNYGVHGCQSGSRIAVCAYTEAGSYYQEFTPPYPLAPADPSTPVVTPPPVPQPAPTPEPKPVSIRLSVNQLDVVKRYVAQFPVPQMPRETAKSDDAFENVCRDWVRGLAEQLRYETGDPTLGVKNAGGGRPQSKDSIAWLLNGRLLNFDMLSGVGTGHPTLVTNQEGADITGQTFVPVQSVNHLDTPPIPPPPVESGSDLAALRNEVAALSVKLALLEGRVAHGEAILDDTRAVLLAIEDKPAAHSGDAVEVTGSVSLSDAYGRKKLTWTGKIL